MMVKGAASSLLTRWMTMQVSMHACLFLYMWVYSVFIRLHSESVGNTKLLQCCHHEPCIWFSNVVQC